MKEYQRIYLSMPNSEIEALISEYIRGDFHRDILKDRMILGMTYEQIADQTMLFINQNNANATNVLNGFNALQLQMANQTNTLSSKLDTLGFNMEQCCCSIKTMLLENRLQDTQIALQNAQNVAVNAEQSQYLLSQMGRWVSNTEAAKIASA